MKKTIGFLVLFFSGLLLFAQSAPPICGTSVSADGQALLEQQAVERSNLTAKLQSNVTIKLQPHIVRNSNGDEGLKETELNISIQQLNQSFQSAGIEFIMCDVNYIDNQDYFTQIQMTTNPNYGYEYAMAQSTLVPDAVNVYFAPNAKVGSLDANWSSFPYMEDLNGNGKNWTVMNNRFATDGETLAHEIGHYFNLLHTHHEGVYDGSNLDKEKVTRAYNSFCKNCETSGDLICDTPADPNLTDKIATNCNYILSEVDDCGEQYFPDSLTGLNIMSYATINRASIGCRTTFTPGQINRMLQSLSMDRSYLSATCPTCPTNLTITSTVNSGSSDQQSASNSITASNVVQSGGYATYDAGFEITLTPSFDAQAGSSVCLLLGGCSSNMQKNKPGELVKIETNHLNARK